MPAGFPAGVLCYMKNLRSMVSRAGRQIAKKISRLPSMTSVISGYSDQVSERPKPKVRSIRNSVSNVIPPIAIAAPPKM